jgi:DNA-binding MarR family transcriptional regulator
LQVNSADPCALLEMGLEVANSRGQLTDSWLMARKLILQEFLPYLLNRAGVRMGLMFSRDVEPLDITLPMWRVMIELWHRGEFRLGELAERTAIDLSTLSRLLVVMQKKGLIIRRRSTLDKRALSLALTPEGLAMSERVAPFAMHYEQLAMKGMSEAEVKTLKRLLQQVFENLETADASAQQQKGAPVSAPSKSTARKLKASA